MDTSTILSAAAVLIALVGLLLNSRKDTRHDAAKDAAGTAKIEAKLDNISTGVEDIRVEIRGMRGRIDSISERLSAVESSCKAAHHRLDTLQAQAKD